MCNIPVCISSNETILRIIIYPYHISKNKKIKPQAFQPPKNPNKPNEISVIRYTYIDLNECKTKAYDLVKKIKNNSKNDLIPKFYGFAHLCAKEIQNIPNIKIEDSRDIYCGHASIIYIFDKLIDNDEKILSEFQKDIIMECAKNLRNICSFYDFSDNNNSCKTIPPKNC